MGRIGVVVNRSHGVKGAVALAIDAALSVSTIATPPEPSAYPQKPLNSKPSGGCHCEKKVEIPLDGLLAVTGMKLPHRVEQHPAPPVRMDEQPYCSYPFGLRMCVMFGYG
jgi:hypothetical protein